MANNNKPEQVNQYRIIPDYIFQIPDVQINHSYALVYGLIYGLSGKHGYCWASNDYLAEKSFTSRSTVIRAINLFTEYGLLIREYDPKKSERKLIPSRNGIETPENKVTKPEEGGVAHDTGGCQVDTGGVSSCRGGECQADTQLYKYNNKYDLINLDGESTTVVVDLDKAAELNFAGEHPQFIGSGLRAIEGAGNLLAIRTEFERNDILTAYKNAKIPLQRGIAIAIGAMEKKSKSGHRWQPINTYNYLINWVLRECLDTKSSYVDNKRKNSYIEPKKR